MLKALAIAAVLLGAGCSHAKPKPTMAPQALAQAPRPPSPPQQPVSREEPQEKGQTQANDSRPNAIFFDFDSALLRSDARATLQKVGQTLKRNNAKKVRIEGNCDERGTTEYNMALGDRRARQAEEYLQRLGVPTRRMSIVSYGSERPADPGHNEKAWAENRRDDFVIQ